MRSTSPDSCPGFSHRPRRDSNPDHHPQPCLHSHPRPRSRPCANSEPPSEPDMLYDPVTDPNIYPGEEGYDPLIHGDLGLDPEGAG